MQTENLRLFVMAAEMLNISAAGRVLGIAPAVASTRLAKLEKTLGADLLHRSTRKVVLSVEGEDFLPYAREILAQEDAAYAAMGRGGSIATGTLRFAAPSTFAQLYIAPLLPDFLAAHSSVNLDLRLTDLHLPLIEGSFDLALRNAPVVNSSLRGRTLAKDTRVLCAAPAYLEQHGTPTQPQELLSHQLIAFKETSAKQLVGRAGEIGEFNPRESINRLIVDDGLSQKIVTIAGAGISMNSVWSVHRELANGSLIRVLPNYTVDDQSVLSLVYPKSNVLTTKVRVFIDFLLERLERLPVWAAAD